MGLATDGVDRGQTSYKVPNLIGQEWSNAQVSLNIKGLKHQLMESSSDQTAAVVTYQYPRAGAEVPYGTTIYLYTDTYEAATPRCRMSAARVLSLPARCWRQRA